MSIYGGTPLPLALATSESDVTDFLGGSMLQGRMQALEAEGRLAAAMHQRLDNIVRAINGMGRR